MSQYDVNIMIDGGIIPLKAIYKGKEYLIIEADNELLIDKLTVSVQNGRVRKIVLGDKCRHPNCDPFTGEFCLPNTMVGAVWGKRIARKLAHMITTYHLDNCYDFPRELFRLKESMTS